MLSVLLVALACFPIKSVVGSLFPQHPHQHLLLFRVFFLFEWWGEVRPHRGLFAFPDGWWSCHSYASVGHLNRILCRTPALIFPLEAKVWVDRFIVFFKSVSIWEREIERQRQRQRTLPPTGSFRCLQPQTRNSSNWAIIHYLPNALAWS